VRRNVLRCPAEQRVAERLCTGFGRQGADVQLKSLRNALVMLSCSSLICILILLPCFVVSPISCFTFAVTTLAVSWPGLEPS